LLPPISTFLFSQTQGICQKSDVERAVANTLRVRFDLGLFDDPVRMSHAANFGAMSFL
jgi:hypothetical protein